MENCARFGWTIFLLLVVSTVTALAQAPRQELPTGERMGQFRDARDLAVDDQGTVYVLDAETATITRFTGQRRSDQALTATDATGDAFPEPVDLDPTNGLRLIVADAGREELQWYSRSFRLLETRTLVSSPQQQSRRSGYDAGSHADADRRGRPTAVASAVTGEVFAVDDIDGVIYRWDSSGRFAGIVGREGEGRLVEPVDLSLSDDLLYAADAGQRSVLVYDRFGSFVRTVARNQAEDVRALSIHRDELYVTLPDKILVYSLRGRLKDRYAPELDSSLVDCVRTDDALYLLTETELLQLPTR